MANPRPRSNSDSEYPGEKQIQQLLSELQQPTPNAVHIPASDYARSWSCALTLKSNGFLTDEERLLLGHVNCSYLSGAQPPTLLALKQHAQSLAILIRKITTSTTFGIPDAANEDGDEAEQSFRANESFDWLNDLGETYSNDDYFHNVPLFALRNTVEGESDVTGIEHRCPLRVTEQITFQGDENYRVAAATHHEVAKHAEECFVYLDHELGATGGLMSLLPLEEDADHEMDSLRRTIFGSWLLHQQHIVGRMHELEFAYARALEVLGNEAVVPAQLLKEASATEREKGRFTVHSQDKFILANVTDEVTEMIHKHLDNEEAGLQAGDDEWRARGVEGDQMRQNDNVSRGLVTVRMESSFSRVKGHGHKSPIFLLPAVKERPDVVHPPNPDDLTVVGVATARWPDRFDVLERMKEDFAQDLRDMEAKKDRAVERLAELGEEMEFSE
jgi:hypothetical protein